MRRMGVTRVRKPLSLALTVLLAGLLAEGGLRLAGALHLRGLYGRPDAGAGHVNVVCLGESSTDGLSMAAAESYPKQLERRLRDFYGNPDIHVIVPPQTDLNTSQMYDRIGQYLDLYRPRLIVLMAGYDNERYLAESHIGRFLSASGAQALEVRLLVSLDRLRLFRLLHHAYLRLAGRAAFAPEGSVGSFAGAHQAAFVSLWRHDVGGMIREALRRGVGVLLMTYHVNPAYLPVEEMVALARDEDVPLVRNDERFRHLTAAGTIERYVLEDGWHPTSLGYSLIADGAFQEIRGRDLLKLGLTGGGPLTGPGVEPFPVLPAGRMAWGAPDVEPYLGSGWSRPEGAFRWTEGLGAEILFGLGEARAGILRLRLQAFLAPGRLDRQRVGIVVNGRRIVDWVLESAAPRVHTAPLPKEALARRNVLKIDLPDAASPATLGVGGDRRRLGVALHWLRLEDFPVCALGRRIEGAEADRYVGEGWSDPEASFRWSDAPRAEILFGLARTDARVLRLKIRPFLSAGRLDGQRVIVELNGHRLASLKLTDPDPSVYPLPLPPQVLGEQNVLTFHLPDARAPSSLGVGGDVRRLGIALHWFGLGDVQER